MKALRDNRIIAERYATDFIKQLHLNTKAEQKCEWTCILWSKDRWTEQARKAKIDLHQTKDRMSTSTYSEQTSMLIANSEFMNTVAQIYSKLFEVEWKSCAVKQFSNCPFMDQRENLLSRGSLANVFVTILQKATFYAMLDRRPLDSGLLYEEYKDVYGIDFTDFQDLEHTLTDRRFEKLYTAVVKRAGELAGLRLP
jgi:hypothetical protein